MPLQLSSPITDVPRIGPAKAKFFKKLGVRHVRDLLYSFPRRYDDFSRVTPVAQLVIGKKMAVRGRVRSVKSDWGFQGRRRLLRIYVDIEDDTGILNVTWYNLRYLPRQLWKGREIIVAGEVEASKLKSKKFAMRSPAFEFTAPASAGAAAGKYTQIHTSPITPIYPETYGITSRFIRYHIKNLLPLLSRLPEYLPADVIKRNRLMDIHEALRAVHFPTSQQELESAQHRLRFDELFFLQLAALVRRGMLQRKPAFPLAIDDSTVQQFVKRLPFALTSAQRKALREIQCDLTRSRPMNRLLQGDVGSGKSAVALIVTAAVLKANYKVLYAAPTEILARQQAQSFAEFLGKDRVSLLIGALRERDKTGIKRKLREHEPVCVVGTHALLQEDVKTHAVGLVIVDEQHRFGVGQRRALQAVNEGTMPHFLSMTATPIPRTLNLTVYGDLDASVLDELPPGRRPIKTKIVPAGNRDEAIIHVLEELHAGRQGYVIAPLVEESTKLEIKSATETYKEMKKLFPGIAVSLVHGQMTSEEKESAMRHFAAGAIQLLVSTAVVEVGVNVPNATVMIIEGAERFGLAQLHQFRGRIGRAQHQSYCYLFPTTLEGARNPRLKILEKTTNGFVIAEEDLKLRGPGEVYGVAQSGFGDLKVASLLDYQTIKLTREEAKRLLQKDPKLRNYPILRKKVEQKNLQTHFE